MTFSEQLNNYINELNCSSQELAVASGLSSTVISRYRKGTRSPNIKSKQLEHLSNGLYKISCNKNISISKDEFYTSLAGTLSNVVIDLNQFSKNFNDIISILNMNIADLSRFVGYDASFISRIRTGSRSPSKPKDFVESVSNFIVLKYKSTANKKAISLLIDCSIQELENDSIYLSKLIEWLSTNSTPNHNYR